jgi:hypothetical protein
MAFIKELITPSPIPYYTIVADHGEFKSTAIDVSNCVTGQLMIWAVKTTSAANRVRGLETRIQTSPDGVNYTVDRLCYIESSNTWGTGNTIGGVATAGDLVITSTFSPNVLLPETYVLIRDANPAKYEIAQFADASWVGHTTAAFNIVDPLLYSHAIGTPMSQISFNNITIDLRSVKWLRISLHNNAWATDTSYYAHATGMDCVTGATLMVSRGII